MHRPPRAADDRVQPGQSRLGNEGIAQHQHSHAFPLYGVGMKNFWTSAALLLALLIPSLAGAAGALGPAGLRAHYAAIAPQLANNVFGGPLVLQSEEAAGHIDGAVYAVLEHPFS